MQGSRPVDRSGRRSCRHRSRSCSDGAPCLGAATQEPVSSGFAVAHRVDLRFDSGPWPHRRPHIRVVRVPIVTGAPLQFVRLPWKSARFEVKRITQDNKGFLWFGASDDLRRYDGVRFIRVPGESPSQRSSGFILSESMMKDRAGMIWFGVDDFVNRYDPETGNTTQFRTSADHACGSLGHAMHITQDHEGRMWIATDIGLRRLDPATSQVTCYRVSADDGSPNAATRLISTLESRSGGLWVASDAGLDLLDPRSGQVTRRFALETASGARLRPSPFPATLFEDRSGIVWVGLSSGADLASVDPATGIATVYAFDRPGLQSASSGVLSILEDDDGALWLGTNGLGLLRLDSDREQAVWYESNSEDPDQLGGGSRGRPVPRPRGQFLGSHEARRRLSFRAPTAVPVVPAPGRQRAEPDR